MRDQHPADRAESAQRYLQISAEKPSCATRSGQAGANFAKIKTPHRAAGSSEFPIGRTGVAGLSLAFLPS
jgi:hypothetical protein